MSAHQVRVGDNSSFRQGNDYHYHQETAATKTPSSIYDVPNLLSPYFIGRDEALTEIHDALEGSHADSPARCVVYGMPGLGKTQVALKYAETVYKAKQYPYIFWISAASIDKLVQGFSRLLDLLCVVYRASLDQSARCIAARAWLEDNEVKLKRHWLLILDNANDETAEKLREMLPRSSIAGKILITTRTESTAKALATAFGNIHSHFGLSVLAVEDAVQLLFRTPGTRHDLSDASEIQMATELVRAVGCLPLAVDQAASLFKTSTISMQAMVEIYQSEQIEDALELKNDLSYEEASVMKAYTFLLRQLEQGPPGTRDLLRILTFLDPERIPIDLLRMGCEAVLEQGGVPNNNFSSEMRREVPGSRSELEREDRYPEPTEEGIKSVRELLHSPIRLPEALQHLQKLSLVSQQVSGGVVTLRLHDLVQVLLRLKLMKTHEDRRQWLLQTIIILHDAVVKLEAPEVPEVWDQWEEFVAHAQALQKHAEVYEAEGKMLLDTCSWTAMYLHARGRYTEAIRENEKVLTKRKELFGIEHDDTLSNMGSLALNYARQGRWAEAEALQVYLLKIGRRVLGIEHPYTPRNMHNLALTYSGQGRWKDAEILQVQVLETMKRVRGAEHPDTLRSIGNLALTYSNQGRLKDAEILQVQVLETTKRALGAERPDTLKSIGNLALTYANQGRWKDAEILQLQVSETTKRVLGAEHPDTLRSIGNLVLIYANHGRWKDAETLQVQVLETTKRVLGAEHPDTLWSIGKLASTYASQGRWKDAETLQVQVLETTKRVLGAEHPDTLRNIHNLASTYRKQGRRKDAEILQVQVLETRKRVLGEEHPDTLRSTYALACTYRSLGHISNALDLMQDVATKRVRSLGAQHPDTIESKKTFEEWARLDRKIMALPSQRNDDRERMAASS